MEVDGGDDSHKLDFPNLPESEEVKDWEYRMRRNMQEIIPNLFLGPYSVASRSQLEVLQGTGITHIICIRHPMEVNRIKPNFPQLFRYLVLDISDDYNEPIMKFFPMAKEFIQSCFNMNGRVLIHGNGGISRSAALVIAYLMESYGLTYLKAYQHVQQKRFCINPNEGFVRQLIEYEPIYMAKLQMAGTSSVLSCNDQHGEVSLKRSFDDREEDSSDIDNDEDNRYNMHQGDEQPPMFSSPTKRGNQNL